MTNQPYADTAEQYWDAGWRGIIPIPAGRKKPAPTGYTGWNGEYPSWADIATWVDHRPDSNLALRLPPTVLGLDVDNYDNKPGAATLGAAEAKWGPLPPTWRSTSRSDGVSGIRMFTVPAGLDWPGELPGGGIETVHGGHRYVVAAPSVHPNGATYKWLNDEGDRAQGPPQVDRLPALPAEWIIGLSRGKHVAEPSADVDAHQWLTAHNTANMCPVMRRATETALNGMNGSRHEHLIKHLLIVVRHGEAGHTGMGEALNNIRDAFLNSVAADKSRTPHEASAECERALAGAVNKVEATPSVGVNGDPCDIGKGEPPNLVPSVILHHPDMDTLNAGVNQFTQDTPWVDPFAEPQPKTRNTKAAERPNLPETGRHLILTSAAAIKPRPVFWLWKGRLALGTLGLLAGREGLGKSTLAYWMAAQITQGTLYGEFQGRPKSVLVCATEDSWEHTIVPRLIAAQADLTKVFRVEVIADAIQVGLTLPRDLIELEDAAAKTDASLLLLDPLMSRLGELDTHRDSEVRMALEPLVAIADRANMAILGLIHHNKSGSTDPLSLIMGSKAFSAVARSVHTVVPDPDDDEGKRRIFGSPKNNLGTSDLPTFTFTIESHKIETDEGDAWTGALAWGEQLAESVADVMRRSSDTNDGEKQLDTSEAVAWLGEYLARPGNGGQAPRADVIKAGAAEGHNQEALKRAMRKLKVKAVRGGFQGGSTWCLPSAVTQGEDTGSHSGHHSGHSARGELLIE